MSDAPAPQPGWYADPENPAAERWWNGSGWSEQQRPATQDPTPASAPAIPAPGIPAPAFPAPVEPAPGIPAVPPVPGALDSTGFTFGAPAAGGARPDPYAPPPPSPTQPYYPAYSPYGARPATSVNGLALAGLLTASIGWFIVPVLAPIVGIVLSIFGLGQATKREHAGAPNSGRGLAVAGIVVGGIVALLQVLFYVAFFGAFFSATSSLR